MGAGSGTVRCHVKQISVKQRRLSTDSLLTLRRRKSLIWMLPSKHGDEAAAGGRGVTGVGMPVQVCKGFFLTTLGFREWSDSVVLQEVSGGEVVAPLGETRGRPPPANRVSEDDIHT